MATFVALLRGVNVVGSKIVRMAALQEMVCGLGMGNVRTLLQSGNLVFETNGRKTPAALEKQLERETEECFGMEVHYLVRTAEELRRVVKDNPFEEEAKKEPARLLVMFMKASPTEQAMQALRKRIVGRERFEVRGREMFVIYSEGQGNSKFSHGLIEKVLGLRVTGRNWNTVQKLLAAAGA